MSNSPSTLRPAVTPLNIVISGTNFWNPGDDFVRDGVIRVLQEVLPGAPLNFLFYNFNADFFPVGKFKGIGNYVSKGDLDLYRDHVDAVVVAGLSAGEEIKDLYRWVLENKLQDRVYLVGAGYENNYVAKHVSRDPEATIFKNARIIVGRTEKTPDFIKTLKTPYAHVNCPAILSVPQVKDIAPGRRIERIGFSIQLSHEQGLLNQSCDARQSGLATEMLLELSRDFAVEVVAHHKTEYFHFLKALRGTGIPVRFSSFYEELHQIYPQYDLVVTTRLHSSLFANGHGIPGIIINDTDRHTHTLDGFPHSVWVNTREKFREAFARAQRLDLRQIAGEAAAFKAKLLRRYVEVLSGPFAGKNEARPARVETSAAPAVGVAPDYQFNSELKEQKLVRHRVKPGMTVLDVGAHAGKYTKLFSLLVGESGRVIAFEPTPESAKRIAQDIVSAGLKNVTLLQNAVAERNGVVTLHQFPEEYSSWNSLGRPQMKDPRNPSQLVPLAGSVDVNAVALDAFCRDNSIDRIDYLKLDVEGVEIRALQGAASLLERKAIGLLQFEISRKMLEGANTSARAVFDYLAAKGYECHSIADDGRIGPKATDSSEFYENYIALPAVAPSAPGKELSVHFFTIVLNGRPFIEHHIGIFQSLPFDWHWHIIEGVAELNHDTAWSKARGGRITPELHRNGRSTDGTTEYLDGLARRFPKNISIHRKPEGVVWDGKLEMVNAPLAALREECLLWQVDSDELWTAQQLIAGRELFLAQPEKTAAFYYCHYFVGERLVVTTRNTYGNNTGYEWIRTWRFTPGCRWITHEPPRLGRPDSKGGLIDLATLNPLRHQETEAAGLVFQHFAYATPQQVEFKQVYYGYKGALEQWRQMQKETRRPLRLGDHLAWVKDEARADTVESAGVEPLARKDADGQWQFHGGNRVRTAAATEPGVHRVLFVRSDSIGDAVLASSMLPHLRAKYPNARLAVVCQEHIAELYAASPCVDTVICFDRQRAMADDHYRKTIIAEIAAFNPDLTLNPTYSTDPLAELLTLSHRAPQTIGLAGDLSNIEAADRAHAHRLYTKVVPSAGPDKTELEQHRSFLAGLGIETGELSPVVWTTPEDEALAEAFFAEHKLDPATTIAVFPGSKHGCKEYPHFAKALGSLTGHRFLFFGGAEVEDKAHEIASRLRATSINLSGRTSLREMAALLRRCRLLVGSDSAGAHLACAVGLQNVVVLGGGHFGRFLPYSPLTSVVCLPLECYGCNWSCKCSRPHCVKDVAPEVVASAIRDALANRSSRPRVYLQPSALWNPQANEPRWTRPDRFLSLSKVEVIETASGSPAMAGSTTASAPEDAPLPDAARTHLVGAEQHFNAGRLEEARVALARAVEAAPQVPALHVALANLHVQRGDLTAAQRALKTAVELSPGDASLQAALAGICLKLQHVEEFEQALAAALKLDPNNAGTLRLLASVNLEHGRFKDAAQFYFRLLQGNDGDIDSLLGLGVCFFKTGDRASAAMTFERVLQLQPDHALARENLGVLKAGLATPPLAQPSTEISPPADAPPVITAIVSTYKSESYMRACLEDLEAQTIAGRLEIIVIDSGSPQNERAIVEEFQRRYSNIRYLRTERETIYAAWNRGVQMARGKYLTNANADDRHTPDAYEKLVAALEARPDCALAYADVAICEHVHPDRGYTEIRGYFRWPEFDVRLLFRDCYMGPQPVWRREVHQRHGLFDPAFKSAGDYEFWLRMARTEKFLHVPEVLGLYWNTPQTAGHADPGLTRREADTARERHWPKEWGSRPKPGFSCVEPTGFVHQTQQTVATLQARVRALESEKTRLETDVQRWMTGAASPSEAQLNASVVTPCAAEPAAALAVLQSAQEKLRERKFPEATAEAARYRQLMNPDSIERHDARTTATPHVSVVIVSYQAGEALLDCIRSLNLSSEVPHETILVDNGGNESVRDALAGLPLLHVSLSVNVGPAEARNIGAHFARSPILCFLDDDAVAAPGYLASIVKAFEAHDIVALRGKVLPKTANLNNRKACHYDLGNIAVPSDLDTEGNSAVLTDAWREMGGMNSLLFGGEGLELSCRLARRHGEASIIYWPDAVIHHDYALTEDKLERKQARHELMRAYLLSLHADAFDYHRRVTAHVESEPTRRAAAKLVRRKSRKAQAKLEAPAVKAAGPRTASQPFISICIPSYNRAAYLPAAIQSALRQTFTDFEVVVVDDGSTDGTAAVLQQFASDKVRCFTKEHSGGPETRNRCVAEARGEFIVWLDSDDVILPGTLERYVQAHHREPAVDVFYGDLQLANERLVHAGIERYRDYHGWPAALLGELFFENRIPNGFTMIRKSCFGKFGGYDRAFPRAHDYEFWTRLAGRCEVRHLDAVVGIYRLHDQSLSKPRAGVDTRYEAAVSRALLKRHRLQELLPWCFGEGTPEALGEGNACRIAALQLLKHADVEGAREWLGRAIKAAPHSRTVALHQRLAAMLGDKTVAGAVPSTAEFDRVVDEAVREYRRGHARECARACARLTDLNPDAHETLLLVGMSLMRWGDPQNGRAALHALLQREIAETAAEVAHAAEQCRQPAASEQDRALQGYLATKLGVDAVPAEAVARVVQGVYDLASSSEANVVSVSQEKMSPLFFALLGMTEVEATRLGRTELWQQCALARRRIDGPAIPRPSNSRRPGYSFCIITNGRRPEKLRRQIESIRALGIPELEILVGGRVLQSLEGVKVVDLPDAAATGNLGLMRNTLAALAQFDHLVVSDDDMVFAPDFFEGLQRFGEGYDALAVRLTNPDGSRFWDWACVGGARGQMLLNYWETSPEVYITGGICVIKTQVWEAVKWDDGRGFYQAEDVDFSRRLQAAGFSIRFNPFARVTHDDDRYTRVGRKVMRLDDVLKRFEAVCRTGEIVEAIALLDAAKRLVANHPAEAEALRRLCKQYQEFLGSTGVPASDPARTTSGGERQANGRQPGSVSVAWDGSFLDLGSLSHVNRELTRSLEQQSGVTLTRLGKNAVPTPLAGMKAIVDCARQLHAQPAQPAQVTVRHAWPPNWDAPANGAWVLIQPWEFGALPKEWVHNLARVDEAWVPSEYVRRVYIDSGVDAAKVHVVPNGIDPAVFHPDVKPMVLATKKAFKFLFVGGTILRKGPDVLLKAYLDAFTAADDVCLVIKDFGGQSVYAGQTFEAQLKAAQANPNAPEILYLNDELPPEALPGLYTACDCLVHPYRGEGFGLPILEAMACGLPVVVTAGGAADDFATDEFAYRLPSIRRTFGQSVSGLELVKSGWMLEPNQPALVERMKWLVAHREEAKAKGRAAGEHVRREWTWECAAQKAAARLQAVAGRVSKVSPPPVSRKVQSIELPSCAKLGHLGEARQFFKAGKLLPAWQATVGALKVRPYHPEAFLLLAEIAQAAGDAKRAGVLVERARKMAPKWKPARKLAGNGSTKNAMPRLDLPALPPFLEPASASGRVPRLSVFLITKNEEKFIGQCLESVRDLASQIVVLDTGSTDWTKTIAERFGAEVHSCAWTDDFSAARNAALERVTGDWVLMLDADEELLPDQKDRLRALLADPSAIAWRLPMRDKNREAEGEHFVPRLFRNAPGLFYVGRIHEQIFSSVEVRRQEWGLENKFGDAVLLHHGYTKEMIASRDKIARNLRLLRLAVEELPGEPNLLMNLGLELVRDGRLDAGLEQYAAAFAAMSALPKAQVTPELRENLLTQHASYLVSAKRPTEAVRVLESPLAKSGGLTASMHWLLGLAYIEQRQFAEGAAQMRECLAKRGRKTFAPVDRNILQGGPHHCLALCLAAVKQRDPADRAFHAALEAEPESRKIRFDYARFLAEGGHEVEALKWLHQLAAEDASEVPVWICGGQLSLRRPEFFEFANDWTGEAFKLHPAHPIIVEQRATALLLNGDAAGALAVWRQAEDAPTAARVAAVLLCELLAGRPVTPVSGSAAAEVGREFLQWYRRLLSLSAGRLVSALHERLELLRPVLPEVARLIGDAVNEANAVPVK